MIIRNVMGSLVQPSGQEAKENKSASVNSGIKMRNGQLHLYASSWRAPTTASSRVPPYGAAGFLNLSQSGERPDW